MTILEETIADKLLEEINAAGQICRQDRINEYRSFLECIRTRQAINTPVFNPYVTTGTEIGTVCCSNSTTLTQHGGQE